MFASYPASRQHSLLQRRDIRREKHRVSGRGRKGERERMGEKVVEREGECDGE